MIRQARRYLVGAASSVTLVSIAIVVFVVLVSAQVFTNWPVGVLGGNDSKAAVSGADAVSAPAGGGVAGAAKTVSPGAAAANATAPNGAAPGAHQDGGGTQPSVKQQAGVGSSDVPDTSSEPAATTPANGNGSEGD